MGLFSFVKNAGKRAALIISGDDHIQADPSETPQVAHAGHLEKMIADMGIVVDDLAIGVEGDRVLVGGVCASSADKEKVVLALGNIQGVAEVQDGLVVRDPEPPSMFYTVEKGDTLSAIAQAHYGMARLYNGIFEANQPMLKSPDEIYPGQMLRVPPVEAPVHTVAKGDTLGAIAKDYYGKASMYKVIFEANGDQLDSPDVIKVGQELTIPIQGLFAEEGGC